MGAKEISRKLKSFAPLARSGVRGRPGEWGQEGVYKKGDACQVRISGGWERGPYCFRKKGEGYKKEERGGGRGFGLGTGRERNSVGGRAAKKTRRHQHL